MKKEIIITYNVITNELEIVSNDFTTFEALGVLEGAKAMIQYDWMNNDD